MSDHPFFPNTAFGWTFYAVLLALLQIATVVDLRSRVVPKSITLPTLGLGLFFNVARGAWLGSLDQRVWCLGNGGAWVGASDGFLFALAGFATGFAIFFLFYAAGVGVGGGDVKLFAALGAWVGPYIVLLVLLLSAALLMVLALLLMGGRLVKSLFGGAQAMLPAGMSKISTAKTSTRFGRTSFTYSFALALATAVCLLWILRFDLLAVPRPERPVQPAASAVMGPELGRPA